MTPLKILLVDDHPIVRSGFRQLLELEPGWKVVAEVGSARELAATLLVVECDVLVLDLNLPDGDGMVMIRQLLAQRPKLAILVMSMHDGALYVQEALAAGAMGYVSKRRTGRADRRHSHRAAWRALPGPRLRPPPASDAPGPPACCRS